MSEVTTIRVHKDTKERLYALAEKGESYEDTILRLLAEKEVKK